MDIQNPAFDDSGTSEEISSFPEFLDTVKSKMNFFQFFRNLKAGLQFVLHAGSIVNNCVTDNPNLPLSAAQGKALQDQLATLNSNLKGFNFYYFKAWSHAHIVSDILDDTAFCILGENYYSTVTKVEGQMYISNVVGNGDITFNNNVVTINIADKFGIIISNKEITIK